MYQIEVFKNDQWDTYATISAEVNYQYVEDFANNIDLDPVIGGINVAVVDSETGEILWDAISCEEGIDYDDCDYEMGYDPYRGCFSDDC